MGRLVYTAITSLDGYVNDSEGGFGWAAPDADVHEHVNDLDRKASLHLYGRRMYEVMSFWADPPDPDPADDDRLTQAGRDYAQIWQGADKIVFSTTLPEVATPRTELRRSFDASEVQALVASAPGDVSVGGPVLAADAFAAGLVDEVNLYVCPVAVGPGGTSWVRRGAHLGLEQRELRRFGNGVVYVRYDVRR